MDLAERMQQLEQQLGRLEEQLVRLQELVGQPVIGGPGRTVQGSKFQMTDDAGKVLAEMQPASDGAKLTLQDNEQKCRATLAASKFGPLLQLERLDTPGAISCWIGDKGEQYIQFQEESKATVRIEAAGKNRSIIFMGEKDSTRLWLQLDEHGLPAIGLRDSGEGLRVLLGGDESGSYLMTLADQDGNSRVGFQVDAAGNPDFYVRSAQGERKLMISFDELKRGLSLYDEQGNVRLIAALDLNDQPHVMLANDDGKPRVSLNSDDEHHGLRIYDSHEKVRLAVTVNADERPSVVIMDATETIRFRITMLPDNSALLDLCNERGKTDLLMTTIKGSPQFIINDQNHKPRAILGMIGNNPSLAFVDEDGQPIFHAP